MCQPSPSFPPHALRGTEGSWPLPARRAASPTKIKTALIPLPGACLFRDTEILVLLNLSLTFAKGEFNLARRSATRFDTVGIPGRAAAGDHRTRTAQRASMLSANRHAGDGAPRQQDRRGRRSKRVAEIAGNALIPDACRDAMRRPGAGDRKRRAHYRKYRKFPIAGEQEAWRAIRTGSGNCGNCRLTHRRIRLLSPARGRGWVRGMRTSLPPHLASPPSGGEEFELCPLRSNFVGEGA